MSRYMGCRVSYPCDECGAQFTLRKNSEINNKVYCPKCRPTKRAVELGDSAASQALSTPEVNPVVGADSTPA